MKKLLFHFDTDPVPSTFDAVVAYDGGADHLIQLAGVQAENVGEMVDGVIYTRPPKEKKNSAIFISGSNLDAGEALLKAVRRKFFANFRVSVMLDSSGCNTTAAAGVVRITNAHPVSGKRAVVLAGTGPVGQRAAVLLAREGAEVVLTSRKLDRAQAACRLMRDSFGVSLTPLEVRDEATTLAALDGAQIVFAAGKTGIQLVAEHQWVDNPTIEVMADVNTEPPLGIEGIDMMDRGEVRHGKLIFGGIGIGSLKLKLHRACIGQLFERNDQVLDALEIYEMAKALASD